MSGDKLGEHRLCHRQQRIEIARIQPLSEKILCDPGWIHIVVNFVETADRHQDFVFIAAGEKWGLLAIDYHVDPSAADALRVLESVAIEESSYTCEICGADGSLRIEGSRKTLCDRHALERSLRLTESEHQALMEQFSASEDRWRPVLGQHRDDGARSDELYERFLLEFPDLDEVTKRFWALNLTRIILARRAKMEGFVAK